MSIAFYRSIPLTELGYAEITANATRNSTTPADVAGLSTTVTVGTRPIIIKFSTQAALSDTANGGVGVDIVEDGTRIAGVASLINSASASFPCMREVRRNPSAGSHTYKIQLRTLFSGIATINADNYTTGGPAFIQVVQL